MHICARYLKGGKKCQNYQQNKKYLFGVISIIIVILISYYLWNKTEENNYEVIDYSENEVSYTKTNKNTEENEIIVHITGEVENEGIIKIKEGARIADVIEAAGGSLEQADLSQINLAYKVSDGQKITIPNIYDEEETQYISSDIDNQKQSGEEALININTATQTELETLPGIGPSTALKIIQYRKENGKFEDIEELKNVTGIGQTKFDTIKELICI